LPITGLRPDPSTCRAAAISELVSSASLSEGFNATLRDVVEFYDRRFDIGLTEQQKADLVVLLNSL
jgi:hypothetical protein